jgi:sec-independent protein translocase protein TatC
MALIISAFVTPTPDVFGQLLIAVPLYLLYEISILLIRWQGKSPRETDARPKTNSRAT